MFVTMPCPCYIFADDCDSEVVKTHGGSVGSLDLPNVGDFVMLIITAVATPQRFYAQMPFGKHALIDQTFRGKEAGTCACTSTYTYSILLCCASFLLMAQYIAYLFPTHCKIEVLLTPTSSTEACYICTDSEMKYIESLL